MMASENSTIPISNPVIDLPSTSSTSPSSRDSQGPGPGQDDDGPISLSNIQIRERIVGGGRENENGSGESSSTSTSSSIPNPNINNKSPFTDDNSASTSSSTSNNKSKSDSKEKDSDSDGGDEKMFECNICLDVAKDAVVSYCGHLFCWQCLHQWLETRPNRQSCPVCKAAISREKVIPLYGRGGSGVDPRSKIPPRPTPTRTEQPESNRFTWGGENGGAGGFHMSFGIGAFPFGFFASAFNWGQPGGPNGMAQNFVNQQQMEEQEFVSKIFLWVALVFIVWLLLA